MKNEVVILRCQGHRGRLVTVESKSSLEDGSWMVRFSAADGGHRMAVHEDYFILDPCKEVQTEGQ
jgi:hypothetical protein